MRILWCDSHRCWYRDLAPDRYHEVSDHAMEALLDQLENLLDSEAQSNPDYEVEYSVRISTYRPFCLCLNICMM